MITEGILIFLAGLVAALVAWTWHKILAHEERLAVLETQLADKLGNTPPPTRRRRVLGFL